MDAKSLVDTLANNLSEIKAKTLGYTLCQTDSEALLDTLAHTLADMEVKKPAETLFDVKTLELVQLLTCMLDTE